MNKTETISIDVQVTNLVDGFWRGRFSKLPPNRTYELIIDYPLSNPAKYRIKTGINGLSLVQLLKRIGNAYRKVYDKEDFYGVWGHYITDLAIEGISINHKTKKIRLNVGS